jgi:hypothetical protein
MVLKNAVLMGQRDVESGTAHDHLVIVSPEKILLLLSQWDTWHVLNATLR